MKYFLYITLTLFLFSCRGNENKESHERALVENWIGKEIIIPKELHFSSFMEDSTVEIPISNYKIVTYVDSVGCLGCKLGLKGWKNFILELKNMELNVPILFYIHPLDMRTLKAVLLYENFQYPICVDKSNVFAKKNNLTSTQQINTFLTNQKNEIIAIGNPIQNRNIKRLYMKILQGQEVYRNNTTPDTEIEIDNKCIELGTFDWQQKKIATFNIKNIGKEYLELYNVVSSCSCTTVEYPAKSIAPGKTATLTVTYRAEQPEVFLREISVYCNAAASPLQLEITGEAI